MPVLGINLGRFGFLFELQPEDWQATLPRLLTGDYRLEQRMTLLAEHYRGDAKLGAWTVVNEVVVCRGGTVRPVRLRRAALVVHHPRDLHPAGLDRAKPERHRGRDRPVVDGLS